MLAVSASSAPAGLALRGTGGSGGAPATPCHVCGLNVIENPGAEQSAGGSSLAHWTTSGLIATRYGSSGATLRLGSPGPKSRGRSYFAATAAAVTTASQLLPLRAGPKGVSGTIEAALSGWLGGYDVKLNVDFYGRGSRLLGTLWIGPVLAAGGVPIDGLRYRLAGAAVPLGSTYAKVSLVMRRSASGHGEDAADDLSLVLYVPGG